MNLFRNNSPADFKVKRQKMVSEQLIPRGIKDKRVLKAMREVPRHHFIDQNLQHKAYNDSALPIEEGQTISQPYIVALMVEALQTEPLDRILEIGTGSGYAAAVLSRSVKTVYTIELHQTLAEQAEARYKKLRYNNITVRTGDGSRGWPEEAPFDGILVSAGAPAIPESLLQQLKMEGRLVIPVGERGGLQKLFALRKTTGQEGEEVVLEDLGVVAFVPLRGEEGWDGEDHS